MRAVAPETAIEGHLAKDGCRLRFGRPPVCYEYACWDVLGALADDEEKYLFRVVSHVMTFAGEGALPRTHLVEVQDLAKLDRARTARLRRRIALAERIFEAARRLLEDGGGAGRPDDWALVTTHFSTKGYRLSRLDARAAEGAPSGGPRLRILPIVRAALVAATLALGFLAGRGAPVESPGPVPIMALEGPS